MSTKPTIEAEFLSAFAADPAVAAPATPADGSTAAVETQAPAPSEDGTPAKPEAVEAPKAEPVAPSLAKRLATIAAAERRGRDADAARAAKEEALKPLLERHEKIRGAKTRAEAARLALDLDDEAEADLYLELEQKFQAAGGAKPKDPQAELEAKIKAEIDARLKARDEETKANEQKALEHAHTVYVTEAMRILEERADEYPLVAIAPPSAIDITDISDAWLTANGEVPEQEIVLKMIQDARQEKLDERRRAAESKKTSAKPATAKAEETSGSKAKPLRGNDAPITPPRKLSIAEEFTEAYRATSGG